MICTTVRHDIGWINLCGLSLQWDEILEGETNKISLIFLAYLFSSLWIKKYGIWICQIDFAFAGLSVLKHSTKEGILSYVLHTILWFHKKKYNMVGMAMSWLQSCWERRIFCHKLATILPRYSILVPRHVAAKVVNKKYSKYLCQTHVRL